MSRDAGRRERQASHPLRRKPKQLQEEPTVFEPASSGGGLVLRAESSRSAGRTPARAGGAASGATDESGVHVGPELDATPPDPTVRSRAREIAARLAVPRPRTDATLRRGSGDLATVPYRGGSDDIDLDRTIEVLAERPLPEAEDILVRERVRTRRSVVLAVDVSGSMKGERLRNAAATVGALAGELERDSLAVIAFWSDAAVLLRLGQPIKPTQLLDTLLQLPARGLTNVAFPLEIAARELQRAPVRDARAVLLSDCVHNAGPDPRHAAGRLARLDVLLDVGGERDVELGRDLARIGRGRLCMIRHHRDVAPALGELFHT